MDDTQKITAIREIFARFDWESDDQQYALEAIEQIVEAGEL